MIPVLLTALGALIGCILVSMLALAPFVLIGKIIEKLSDILDL